MHPVRVGLVADPAKPTEVARGFADLDPPGGKHERAWDIEVVSEPFTVECEDVDTALSRLTDHADGHQWDLVVGLTELPLRYDDGRYLLIESVMGGSLRMSFTYGDLFVLTWFVASAATIGGGLGSGLESDEAIRAAAYSKREEERRSRLAREGAEQNDDAVTDRDW